MGKLTLVKPQINYEKYGLKRNPFPYAGIPQENPPFCADREHELDKIGEAISLCMDKTSTNIALVGGYGNGKTHLLRYIKSQVNVQLNGENGTKAIAGYVMTPGHSLIDTYRNFMQDLGREFFTDLVWEFLGRIALSKSARAELDLAEDCKRALQKDLRRVKGYVEKGIILLSELMKMGREILLGLVKNVDTANGFLQLIAEETAILAWKWISGEPILYEQRRRLGIVSIVDTDDRALSIFQDIRNILNELSYQLVCILMDEFELIEILQYQQKQRFLNSIRHLIDLNPSGLCLIISCTPEVWKNIVKEYHAFSERIFREIILKPLDKKTIYGLIREYLDFYRVDSFDKHDSLFPFTNQALLDVLEASQGNMRRVLAICNMVIDIGLRSNHDSITPALIKRVYER